MIDMANTMTKAQAVSTVLQLFRHFRSTTSRAVDFYDLLAQGHVPQSEFLAAEDALREMAASFEFAICTHCDGVAAPLVKQHNHWRMEEAGSVFGCVCPEPRRWSEDETEHNPDCKWRAAVENGNEYAEQMKIAESYIGEVRINRDDARAKPMLDHIADKMAQSMVEERDASLRKAFGDSYESALKSATAHRRAQCVKARPCDQIECERCNPARHLVSADAKQWHCDIGFPEGFVIDRYTRSLPDILIGSEHYEERRFAKGLPQLVSKQWVIEAQLITIMREGGNLTRYAVRGPWNAGHDLTVAIDAAQGQLITGWFNRKGDWHRLTKSEYEQP